MEIPKPGRPFPLEGYGIPEDEEGLLSWDFVAERMARTRNYWVATVNPDGRPHAVPVWGIWLNDTVNFGGGPNTRWSRNLANNPHVVVHSESGDEVVIMEGTVDRVTDPEVELMQRLDDAYEAKYNMRHGPPIWMLRPHKVLAWKEYPVSVTRWLFKKN